jgi:hypothetical protein
MILGARSSRPAVGAKRSGGSQAVSSFRPQLGHDFSEVRTPQPERSVRRGVSGPQVGAGREDRDPGVSEALDRTR